MGVDPETRSAPSRDNQTQSRSAKASDGTNNRCGDTSGARPDGRSRWKHRFEGAAEAADHLQ